MRKRICAVLLAAVLLTVLGALPAAAGGKAEGKQLTFGYIMPGPEPRAFPERGRRRQDGFRGAGGLDLDQGRAGGQGLQRVLRAGRGGSVFALRALALPP
jgi:hypothetical protein